MQISFFKKKEKHTIQRLKYECLEMKQMTMLVFFNKSNENIVAFSGCNHKSFYLVINYLIWDDNKDS